MNPIDEFRLEKKALGMGDLRQLATGAAPVARNIGQAALYAGGTAASMAAFAGTVSAARKMYYAATKARDFKRMLEANPDLRAHHEQDPAGFNRMFSALRTMAPEFTREPLVAGSYMRRGMEGPVEDRGGVAVRAMSDYSTPQAGPLSEAAMAGYARGLGTVPSGKPAQLQGQTRTTYKPTEVPIDPNNPGAGSKWINALHSTEEVEHRYK